MLNAYSAFFRPIRLSDRLSECYTYQSAYSFSKCFHLSPKLEYNVYIIVTGDRNELQHSFDVFCHFLSFI
jgi:hypothetical protein